MNRPVRFRHLLNTALWCCGFGVAVCASAQETQAPAKTMSLKEAVLLAVRANASLNTAYLERVLDRFRLEYAKAEFHPQGQIKFDIGRSNATPTRQAAALDLALALPTGGKIEFGWSRERSDAAALGRQTLQWTQPLLRGAGRVATAELRRAELAEVQARLQLRGAVMATVTAVIAAYRSVQETRAQIGLARDALQRSRTLAETQHTLVENGRLGRLELLQTDADIAGGELEVLDAETRADNARLALLKLLDMDLRTEIVPEEIDTGASAPTSPALPDTAHAITLAETLRPDYLSVRNAERMAELGLEKARDARLWQLDWVVTATRAQQADITAPPQRSAGLMLTIPLNDRAARLALSGAEIEQKKAARQTSDVAQALKVEVLNALRNAASSARQTVLARHNVDLNRQKLDAELTKLGVGRSSLFQVSTYQQNLKQAEQTRITALIAHANALARLDLTLGTTLQTWEILLD